MRNIYTILWAFVVMGVPSHVLARADILTNNRGSGFRDTTPVEPVGGNPGTTLAEQRRLVVERAVAMWAARLDSSVPILVDIRFEELGCDDGNVTLAGAFPTSTYGNLLEADADPKLAYVSALANSLVGRDLDPDIAEIELTINSSVDDKAKCGWVGGFYYGFDGRAGDATEFLSVVLHEVAHGLGISSRVTHETGEIFTQSGLIDSFSAHIYDLDLNASWTDLSPQQRRQSALHVRRVAWDGPRARQVVASHYELGYPSLTFDRSLPGYSGAVATVNMDSNPAFNPTTGPVVPILGCSALGDVASGSILLVPLCSSNSAWLAALVEATQPAGVLIAVDGGVSAPASPLALDWPEDSSLPPMLTISASDANAVLTALEQGPLTATLGGDPQRYLGADDAGRPLLYTSQPVEQGSSVSHLESLTSPDELMEPHYTAAKVHDMTLTVAMLADIGWSARCGDGRLDAEEECDDGARNSDANAGSCRSDCRRPYCGDSVVDSGELCDDGLANSDTQLGACPTTCKMARCGDGVVNEGEACDGTADCSDRCQLVTTPYSADGADSDSLPTEDDSSGTARRGGGCQIGLESTSQTTPLTAVVGLVVVSGRWCDRARRRRYSRKA